jgi:hydroxyethylthiazole kinase-like uncharacterized protein yjeF
MKIVTAAEMREIDRVTSVRYAVPSLTLMENAGSAVAEFALERFPSARTFGVVCGKGNNGGDGFVAARKILHAGREARVLLLADASALRGDAAENFRKLAAPVLRSRAEEVFECDVLIDALLGTGFKPPLSRAYAEAIAGMNASGRPIIAIDIPSGADADVMGHQTGSVVRADAVITFTAPRPAHIFGDLTSGPTMITTIGSPDIAIKSSLNLNLITPQDISPLIAPRPRNSNKGMYGHVLVVGGSLGKPGAAAMAGFSALRAGGGLATVATPVSVLNTVAGFHPELMTAPLKETDAGSISLAAKDAFDSIAAGKTVLAIGPGISRHHQTAEFVRTIVAESEIPVVLDADGINAFEGKTKDLSRGVGQAGAQPGLAAKTRTLVLTPHPGEMARLTLLSTAAVQRDRIEVARQFAREHDLIIVLKGDRTIVARPDGEAWVNPTGNPGMSTGGTGDILTGIIAGMLAQNPQKPFESVLAAVFLHGMAGDVACQSTGEHSLVATDLVRALPEAYQRTREESGKNWVKI